MIYKPALVVMAAGLGSRYGGLKQIDPITEQGEIILDFSLYDAMLAGFEEIVFVIKRENEEDFRALIDERAGSRLNVHYAFQDITDLPDGFSVPEGREKPWGTGHAVLAARGIVAGPFAVINADDYYGSSAFHHMYDFLERACPAYVNYASAEAATDAMGADDDDAMRSVDDDARRSVDDDARRSVDDDDGQEECARYSMVAFQLSNTLSESGHVARGVCKVSDDGKLLDIHERTMIKRLTGGEAACCDGAPACCDGEQACCGGEAACCDGAQACCDGAPACCDGEVVPIGYSEDGGDTWTLLAEDTPVSMNFWGFTNDFMVELEKRFSAFLETVPGTKKEAASSNADPLKAEYFLPGVVDQLLKEGKAEVQVLRSSDKWYGVTYKEDKPDVADALRSMKDKGLYPDVLWG